MDNRWEAFSDEELSLLGKKIDSTANHVVEDMYIEIQDELTRRREEAGSRPVYQGPGTYVDTATGEVLKVFMKVTVTGADYLLIEPDLYHPDMWSIPATALEVVNDHGNPLYEYEKS